MSGSGSAVFGLFPTEARPVSKAQAAAERGTTFVVRLFSRELSHDAGALSGAPDRQSHALLPEKRALVYTKRLRRSF